MFARGSVSFHLPHHRVSTPNSPNPNHSLTLAPRAFHEGYARFSRKSNHSFTYAKTGGRGDIPVPRSDHACYLIPFRQLQFSQPQLLSFDESPRNQGVYPPALVQLIRTPARASAILFSFSIIDFPVSPYREAVGNHLSARFSGHGARVAWLRSRSSHTTSGSGKPSVLGLHPKQRDSIAGWGVYSDLDVGGKLYAHFLATRLDRRPGYGSAFPPNGCLGADSLSEFQSSEPNPIAIAARPVSRS